MNIYICGVGGQGIGMLSETLIRAADYAGLPVTGVDTHGLAQRGGQVSSHLKTETNNVSPLVMKKDADLVIGLERHEAGRGMNEYLKFGGTLLYYDTVRQPLPVRLGQTEIIENSQLQEESARRGIRLIAVPEDLDLPDPVMQNTILLAEIAGRDLISGIKPEHCLTALADLLPNALFEKNRDLFDNCLKLI